MDIKTRVIELNTERIRAIEQEKQLVDETAGRERSAEETQKLDRIGADIARIDREVHDFVARSQRDNDFAEVRSVHEELFTPAQIEDRRAAEDHSVRSWLAKPVHERGEFEVNITRARRERELLRAGATAEEMRAMNYQTSSGSLVVPTDMERSLYQYLEAAGAAFRVGAAQMNTTAGNNIQIPKLGAHGIAIGSIPQGTAIAGTDPSFGQITLGSFKYGQLVAVSTELLRDAAFDIASWLGQDIGYALGRLVDTDLITGVGSTNPTGMTVLAGAGTNAPIYTGGSLITPTYEKLVDTVYTVNDAYRSMGAAWLMKDVSAGTLRKLRDGAGGTIGAVLWEPSLTNGIQGGQPDRFLGYPVYSDFNCAAPGSNAIFATFGWFGEYVIRTVGNVMIETSDQVYFATDQTAFRGKWTVDGDHRDVGALAQVQMHV